ncbi:hypothetical protein [Erysipelothrix rhusiopathiae]|uniref:hypothetical protein n=1 Tax=Erysipelothrix rhusiopathiae TaxID=1648 RepID=UPI00247FB73C|nr:hypothetical protein [Erysipelothrix rhusiopathiae]
MKKCIEWLKTSKGKQIAALLIVLLIALIVINLSIKTKKENPIIIFKENIVVEYGQKSFIEDDQDESGNKSDKKETLEKLPVLVPEDIIQKDLSKYDEISFNKIAVDGEPITLELRFIDTSTIGKHEGLVYARLGKNVQEFKFNYEVQDTRYPVIEGENQVKLRHDEAFDLNLYNAYDIIDGDLEITIDGMKDEAGTFDVTLKATDKNKNTTKKTVKVTREETPVVESTTNTGNGSASSFDNNLANVSSNIIENSRNSNSNNNNSGGNTEIINSNDGSSDESETWSGNTIPSSPVEPQKPSRPGPEAPSGMIYYKDYGSFDGCSAESRNVAKTNVKTMVNTLCDSYGYMYYTPKG